MKEVELTEEQKSELFKLVPQKIQSTAYETADVMVIDWEDAKDMTAGFVFFGEKFTLDSYLFDLMTAGSAEKEYAYMPNMQTALIIPDALENNSDAAEMVDLWMNVRIVKEDILEDSEFTQYSSYNKVKQDAIEKLREEVTNPWIMNTIYHKWIDMIGYLINEAEENAPYFKLDPVYRLKNLVTYMGSYTELKHDTLLYVKQAYAEMWWGGSADCNIEVDPPLLPVPKWYIEADIDVVNKLIELNNETKSDFSELDDYILNNFRKTKKDRESILKLIKDAIEYANMIIYEKAKKNEELHKLMSIKYSRNVRKRATSTKRSMMVPKRKSGINNPGTIRHLRSSSRLSVFTKRVEENKQMFLFNIKENENEEIKEEGEKIKRIKNKRKSKIFIEDKNKNKKNKDIIDAKINKNFTKMKSENPIKNTNI